jgi:peptidoglycan-N-acetylglucosamine deacetylase
MKKAWMYLVLVVIFWLVHFQEVNAQSNEKSIPVAVNDQFIHFPDALPLVKNQTTYVPVRFFSDEIKASLAGSKPGIVHIKTKEKSLILYTKLNEIHFSNGKKKKVNLFVQNGRTYAPLRSLGEFFGYQVHYIPEGPLVRLVNRNDITKRQLFLKNHQASIKEFYEKAKRDQRPKVYLTFDDGPNPGIQSILDILKKKDAKASFFMIETQMRSYPNEVKQLVKEGHYPALHSVSHNRSLLYEGKPNAVANEMLKTQKTLLELTGIKSSLTRVPYGSKPYMTKSFRDELVRHQFKMWDWNIDSLDWKYRSEPKKIFENVKSDFQRVKNTGKPIVILFHINSGTIAALPEVIDYLNDQGYQCVAYNPTEHLIVNYWDDKRL